MFWKKETETQALITMAPFVCIFVQWMDVDGWTLCIRKQNNNRVEYGKKLQLDCAFVDQCLNDRNWPMVIDCFLFRSVKKRGPTDSTPEVFESGFSLLLNKFHLSICVLERTKRRSSAIVLQMFLLWTIFHLSELQGKLASTFPVLCVRFGLWKIGNVYSRLSVGSTTFSFVF